MRGDTLLCEHCNTRSSGPLNSADGSLQRCPNCYKQIYPHGAIGYRSASQQRRVDKQNILKERE